MQMQHPIPSAPSSSTIQRKRKTSPNDDPVGVPGVGHVGDGATDVDDTEQDTPRTPVSAIAPPNTSDPGPSTVVGPPLKRTRYTDFCATPSTSASSSSSSSASSSSSSSSSPSSSGHHHHHHSHDSHHHHHHSHHHSHHSHHRRIHKRRASSLPVAAPSQPLPAPISRQPSSLPRTRILPSFQPLITCETLKELDLDAILKNPQLRHDLLFDPGLQFRPTTGRRKRDLTDKYWLAVQRELETGCTCTSFDQAGNQLECVCHLLPSLTAGSRISSSSPSSPSLSPSSKSSQRPSKLPSRIPPLITQLRQVLLSVIHPAPPVAHVAPRGPAVVNSTSLSPHARAAFSATVASAASAPSRPTPSRSSRPAPSPTPASPLPSTDSALLHDIFDTDLITQQIAHGIFDPTRLFSFLGQVLTQHCAPMRDRAVDKMVAMAAKAAAAARAGHDPKERRGMKEAVKAIRMCFEILELMKLDIANHQLHALRPYLLENAAEFEMKMFQSRHYHSPSSLPTIRSTRAWLHASYVRQLHLLTKQPGPPPSRARIIHLALCSGLADLIFTPPNPLAPRSELDKSLPVTHSISQLLAGSATLPPATSVTLDRYPETLYLDHTRLIQLTTDAADLTALYMLLMLYRQLVFAKGAPIMETTSSSSTPIRSVPPKIEDAEIDKVKREIWEIGPARLGFCFLAGPKTRENDITSGNPTLSPSDAVPETAPSSPAASTAPSSPGELGSLPFVAPRASSPDWAKWRKNMMNVVLQVAVRADEARSGVPSSPTAMPAVPTKATLALLESWVDTHLQPESPIYVLMRDRLKAAVLDVVVNSIPSWNITAPPPPAASVLHHHAAMRQYHVPAPAPNSDKPPMSTGLEPLMPEIKHLGERAGKLAAFHSNVYSVLYESDGFLP